MNDCPVLPRLMLSSHSQVSKHLTPSELSILSIKHILDLDLVSKVK
jgi:hypothetical protein